jgi:hypothetical protein
MSFDILLERKINAGSRVVWKVNIFKGLELKYESKRENKATKIVLRIVTFVVTFGLKV